MYQTKKGELGRNRFFEIFGDLPKEEQLDLINKLSKIIRVARL